MTEQHTPTNALQATISLDRLTVCFNDANIENVNATCGLLKSEHYLKDIPGLQVTSSQGYEVQAKIPFPFMSATATKTHPVILQAGPYQPKRPSYRLDFNPARMPPGAIDELIVFLDTIIDASPVEFFSLGRVTRVDVAVDLIDHDLDDVIVLAKGKQKHGVYSDRYGTPEMVYLGTPKSPHRVACYTKTDKASGESWLRLEPRVKPKCLGKELIGLDNPIKGVQLLPVSAIEQLDLGFPSQLLADSIRVRGLKHALAALDANERKLIGKVLQEATGLLPDADQLWAGWPNALIQSGLGKELGILKQAVKLVA